MNFDKEEAMRGQRSRDFVVGQRMNETMYLSRIGREGRREKTDGMMDRRAWCRQKTRAVVVFEQVNQKDQRIGQRRDAIATSTAIRGNATAWGVDSS